MAELLMKDTRERIRCGKIVALARTYRKHAEEMHAELPPDPVLFLKPASAVIHDGGTVVLPTRSQDVHHEVELGIVIGDRCSHIPEEGALDHVLGYLLGLDLTARDVQAEAKKKGLPWSIAKGFDTFATLSPIIPQDAVPDPHDLDLELRVNGQVRQSSNTRNMVHSVARIISFVSDIMTLERGDVILTGTPEGVGPVVDGDVLEASLGDLLTIKVDAKRS